MEGHAQPLGRSSAAPRRPFGTALESARVSAWTLAALTAIAFGLRLTSLSRSLFNDETFSFALAQRSFGHMISLAGYEANGMPYSVILWPVTRIFGTSVEVMRAPSVLIGTASVPVMYWAARRFSRERWVALLAAMLLAVNPMAIWYSQVARSYALVVLGACAAFGALARALAEDDQPARRRMWWCYVVAMALTGYSDLLAPLIILPAQALMVWGVEAERRGDRARGWVQSLAGTFVVCIPLLVASAIERGRRDPLYWLPKLGRGLVEAGVQEFSGGYAGVKAVGWLTLLVAAAMVAGATWRLRRRKGEERRALGIAAAWGVLPPAGLLLVSAVEPVFWPRYAIVALPGLCLLLALSAAALAQRGWLPAVAGLGVGALLCLGLYADVKQVDAVQQEWKPIANRLKAERRPGQPLIAQSVLTLPSLGYYDPALRASNGEVVVDEWKDTKLPPGVIGYKDPTAHGGDVPDGPPPVALVRSLARAHGTVWILFAETGERIDEAAAVTWAKAHCHVEELERTRIELVRVSGCTTG